MIIRQPVLTARKPTAFTDADVLLRIPSTLRPESSSIRLPISATWSATTSALLSSPLRPTRSPPWSPPMWRRSLPSRASALSFSLPLRARKKSSPRVLPKSRHIRAVTATSSSTTSTACVSSSHRSPTALMAIPSAGSVPSPFRPARSSSFAIRPSSLASRPSSPSKRSTSWPI